MIRVLRYYLSQSIENYVIPSRIGGASSQNLYEIYSGKFKNIAILNKKKSIPGATIITTPQQCKKAVDVLMKTDTIVAWDTQTFDLDIKNQAPVGHGKIICASFFAGPQYNFGQGSKVFIDNFGTNAGLIDYFKGYLENQNYKKVWHNYGFDRHIFYNHGINVRGFGGDTMHMARLYDASKLPGEYSLAALTKSYRYDINAAVKSYIENKKEFYKKKLQKSQNQIQKVQLKQHIKNLQEYSIQSANLTKNKMQNLFYRKKILKTGQQGKTLQFPSILTLHTNQQYIENWIKYSVLDSQCTFFLRNILQKKLLEQKSQEYPGINNMWILYQKYWLPFGQALTDMERQGFKMNIDHIGKIKQQANKNLEAKKNQFIQYMCTVQNDPNIKYFNPASTQQMQQFLHAPYKIKMRTEIQAYDIQQEQLLKASDNNQDEISSRKGVRKAVVELAQQTTFTVTNGKLKVPMKIKGLGIAPVKLTPKGMPSVDQDSLSILAGKPSQQKYGKAYQHFVKLKNPQFGKNLCKALGILVQYRNIQTLLKTFIEPLSGYIDQENRIHCSLNINTQTGRLSARKPNLQNQPALQKDIFKIRSAFIADKGKKLIVADYGQLQLRVLAHLSNCKEMIKAFKEGGDFHSRTAIGMYDYIKKQINQGTVLLEWDKSKGPAPVPLIKDKYAAQRRKAKTVNFSIAYGKSARGFAQDWKCSQQQARKVIRAWFNDRKQVQMWQIKKKEIAKNKKYTQTLLGRFRSLEKFFNNSEGMVMRRAINTPIQGGAADIVIAAMVKIHKNQQLKKLGWKLQLQIHDELILEGPQQTAGQALKIVKADMCHPFQQQLLIELEVDAKIGNNWYECK